MTLPEDRLNALASRVRELEKALEPFAEAADRADAMEETMMSADEDMPAHLQTLSDLCRRARHVLRGSPNLRNCASSQVEPAALMSLALKSGEG